MTNLLEDALSVWAACPETPPEFGRRIDDGEKARREVRLGEFVEGVQRELASLPTTRSDRREAHARITRAFRILGETSLGLDEAQLRLLIGDGFSAIGTKMARRARAFDPSISIDDVLQASRNAWTACGLRMLFGNGLELTPSIFAYSMMYPYSDNYLDDPAVPAAEKGGFNERFRRRLAGEDPAPANRHEESLWRLAEIVEEEHPRDRFPLVYGSLLQIQRAQEDSLALLRAGPADVLRLSLAKGGASVLTDAQLATDSLTASQARFAFCWGVLLQLGDDLQDVQEDRSSGLRTLFAEAAARGTLDALTSRTIHFARAVMAQMRELPGEFVELRQLIARSSLSLIIRSAGEAGEYYSAPYLERLEGASPFRFQFLAERRKQIGSRRMMLARLFEAFLAGDDDEPAFPWMPGGF